MDEISERIFSLLNSCGMEQKGLADALGISPDVVSLWNRGKSKSYLKYLPQIAEALGTTVDYLLTGNEKEPVTESDDGLSKDFIRLFHRLTPEQKGSLIALMRSMLNG